MMFTTLTVSKKLASLKGFMLEPQWPYQKKQPYQPEPKIYNYKSKQANTYFAKVKSCRPKYMPKDKMIPW